MAAHTYAPKAPTRENPLIWKSGPDEKTHQQYYAWLKHKSQAAYRGEAHTMTFDQWLDFWNTDWAWENRGRKVTDLCLTRKDPNGAWSQDNCEIITRHEQFIRQGAKRFGGKRRTYVKKSDYWK